MVKIKNFNENSGMVDETGRNLMDKYFSTVTLYEIYDDGFNSFIMDVYGKSIEIEAEEERLYESSLQFGSIKKRDLNKWEISDMKFFDKDGTSTFGAYPGTRTLLIDMCNKNIIMEGDYIIVSSSQ